MGDVRDRVSSSSSRCQRELTPPVTSLTDEPRRLLHTQISCKQGDWSNDHRRLLWAHLIKRRSLSDTRQRKGRTERDPSQFTQTQVDTKHAGKSGQESPHRPQRRRKGCI